MFHHAIVSPCHRLTAALKLEHPHLRVMRVQINPQAWRINLELCFSIKKETDAFNLLRPWVHSDGDTVRDKSSIINIQIYTIMTFMVLL